MLGCWLLGCWLGSWFCCWVVAGFFSIVSLTCWALSGLFDLGVLDVGLFLFLLLRLMFVIGLSCSWVAGLLSCWAVVAFGCWAGAVVELVGC